jgi:hypothetical protein
MPILITFFLLLAARADKATNHPAEDGIKLSVIMAAHLHTKADLRPFIPGAVAQRNAKHTRTPCISQMIF